MKTFIPLETDIFNDNRMSALLNKMGAAGFGIYMILIIELRNHKNYSLNSETLKVIARKYRIRSSNMEQVLHNYDLFIVENTPDNSIAISSEYVTRVMQKLIDKQSKLSIAGKKGADKRWAKESSKCYSHPIATEKNIKEKKTSVKEINKEKAAVDVNYMGSQLLALAWHIGILAHCHIGTLITLITKVRFIHPYRIDNLLSLPRDG